MTKEFGGCADRLFFSNKRGVLKKIRYLLINWNKIVAKRALAMTTRMSKIDTTLNDTSVNKSKTVELSFK